MDLRDWRKAKEITLEQAAVLFAENISTLSQLERGERPTIAFDTAARIEAVTKGAVTLADLMRVHTVNHPDKFTRIRAAGRAAWSAFKKPTPARRKK